MYSKYRNILVLSIMFISPASFSQSINLDQLGDLSRVIGGDISSDISDVDTTEKDQTSKKKDDSTI